MLVSLMGCSGGGPSSGTNTVSSNTTTQTAATTTGSAPTTGSPAATPSATPGKSEPPGDPAEGFDKASSQKGYDDVKKLGKNPHAGDAAATAKGKELYSSNCVSCHGESGMGDGPAGMALDPKPRNQTDKAEYKYGTGDLAIFRTIKYGIEGTGMAPMGAKLSDDEVWMIVNHVKTLQK